MAQILVRDLDPATVERLKRRAKNGGRSLQAEVKMILEQAAKDTRADMRSALKRIRALRRGFQGRSFPDSTQLIREDRSR
jgi:plasmid stability protein